MPQKKKKAGGFGGGIPGLNEDYERYQSGADLDFDTDLWRALEERYGRQIGDQFERIRADELDRRFDTAIMPSSIQGIYEAELGGQERNALSDALTEAFLGLRGQNLGLTSDFAGYEASNLGSKRQLAGQKANASAMRYGADRSASVGMAGINAQREQAAWDRMMDIADLQYADELGQWNYGTNFEDQNLDLFLNRAGGVAGQGYQTTGGYVPSTNPWLQAGNTAMGAGLMLYGGGR